MDVQAASPHGTRVMLPLYANLMLTVPFRHQPLSSAASIQFWLINPQGNISALGRLFPHCPWSPISLLSHKIQCILGSQAKYNIMCTTKVNTQTKFDGQNGFTAHYVSIWPLELSIITLLLTELNASRPLCCSLNILSMFLS